MLCVCERACVSVCVHRGVCGEREIKRMPVPETEILARHSRGDVLEESHMFVSITSSWQLLGPCGWIASQPGREMESRTPVFPPLVLTLDTVTTDVYRRRKISLSPPRVPRHALREGSG